METFFSTVVHRASRFALWLKAPMLAFFIAGDVYLFGYFALHGSEARQAAEQQLQQDIDQEDHAVCTTFRLGADGDFDLCAQELAHVRQRQEERLDAASPF